MKDFNDGIRVEVADASHERYAEEILGLIKGAALERDAGIACRTRQYIATKMRERKAVIALYGEELAGFCYIECWENKQYVSHSGLVVVPRFRGRHLATRIKQTIFSLTRLRWPHAKIFGLTSSSTVMHINSMLGYVPVPFSELTSDEVFWKSCGSIGAPGCVNCDVLTQSDRKYCVCTGMLFDPLRHQQEPLPVDLPQEVVDFVEEAEL